MNWNNEQLSAIAGILKFIKKPFNQNDASGWAIVVNGFAGTGKTTLVQEAIKQAVEVKPQLSVCVTAPTNKATQVLRDFGREAGIVVDSGTIHSLLGLVLGDEGENRSCFKGGEGNFSQYDIVVVDEASMQGNLLMNTTKERAMLYGVKVIFMGDVCQVNPPKETTSRVFDKDEVAIEHKLTINERVDKESPINRTVTAARLRVQAYLDIETDANKALSLISGSDIEKQKRKILRAKTLAMSEVLIPAVQGETTEQEDGVHVILGKEFYDTMLDQFDCEEYANDPRFCRILAWTNREVERLNHMIRQRIHGKGCADFIVGESLTILTPVLDPNGVPVIFTDDECVVQSVGTVTIKDKSDFDTLKEGHPSYLAWVLQLKLPEGRGSYKVYTLHNDSAPDHTRRLKKLKSNALAKKGTWKKFYAFKSMLTVVRPVHAMTVHKSQGQTFKNVFIQSKDIQKNFNPLEQARLDYVAKSRPTTNLIVNLKQMK